MEDSDEEDNIQVIVFGNSTEANFDDFYKPDEITKQNEEDKNNTNTNNSLKNEIQNDEIEDLDLDAQVLKATKENQVFMKYEYTHEKPWAFHPDKSMWFNYNFDENSFKEWVQKHIDRRIEKQQNYQIENSDNIYNEILQNNVNTSTHEEDLQNSKSFNYKNQNTKNKMKYKNVKNNFYNKNNMMNNFNKDNISFTFDGSNFDNQKAKNEDFYIHSNKNKIFDCNKDAKNNFIQNYNNANNYNFNYNNSNNNISNNNLNMNSYNNNNNNNNNISNTLQNSNSNINLKNDTAQIPIQNEDLKQLQNLINFFKENPEV